MEVLSPLLLMTLLVWGWSRSVEEHHHSDVFVNKTLPVSLLVRQDLLSNSKSLLELCPPSLLAQQVGRALSLFLDVKLTLSFGFCAHVRFWVSQHLSAEELGVLVLLMREEVAHGLGGFAFRNLTRSFGHGDATPISPALAELSLKCIASATQVSSIVDTFNVYAGPVPVPSFDAFVQAHKLLQRSLSESSLHLSKIFSRFGVWRASFAIYSVICKHNWSDVSDLVAFLCRGYRVWKWTAV